MEDHDVVVGGEVHVFGFARALITLAANGTGVLTVIGASLRATGEGAKALWLCCCDGETDGVYKDAVVFW